MSGRTVSTAPKDGTAVWILVGGHPYIGYYYHDDAPWAKPQWLAKATYRRRDGLPDDVVAVYGTGLTPTAWQPLPSPPASKQDKQEAGG